MLPASNRMRDARDFSATVRRGRRSARGVVVVHLADGTASTVHGGGGGAVRVGLVVSRAVGPAVVRNRVKRRLRAQLTARLGALPPAVRIVVRANPAAGRASSAQLAADLDAAFARLGMAG